MEYTKENVLRRGFANTKDYSVVLKLKKSIVKNKFIIILLIALTMLASINIMLVNKFVQKMQVIEEERYTYLEGYIN